jgi:hypothetical protein
MLKSIGLALLGLGAIGCVMLPFDYIPSQLGFLAEQKKSTLWAIFIGLAVVGGVLWYMGMKADKAEEEKNSQA